MPSKLRRIDEYGHTHFLTILCYRRLQFFRHDSVKQVFVDAMRRTREKLGIRWIGYRYYELDDDSMIQMDWDGSWPIV